MTQEIINTLLKGKEELLAAKKKAAALEGTAYEFKMQANPYINRQTNLLACKVLSNMQEILSRSKKYPFDTLVVSFDRCQIMEHFLNYDRIAMHEKDAREHILRNPKWMIDRDLSMDQILAMAHSCGLKTYAIYDKKPYLINYSYLTKIFEELGISVDANSEKQCSISVNAKTFEKMLLDVDEDTIVTNDSSAYMIWPENGESKHLNR